MNESPHPPTAPTAGRFTCPREMELLKKLKEQTFADLEELQGLVDKCSHEIYQKTVFTVSRGPKYVILKCKVCKLF